MGSDISGMMKMLSPKHETRILMIGLDGAGKTTILYKLKLGEIVITIPTIGIELYTSTLEGFNLEILDYKNTNFTVWDCGGQYKIRPLWNLYCHNTRGIIFVVDSNDRGRITEARESLHSMLNKNELRDAALLVYANKHDLPNAMTIAAMIDKLDLNSLGKRRWHIESTCAATGQGLYEGLDWLSTNTSCKD